MDITTNIAIKQSQHHTHKSTTIITSTRIALCGAMMYFCSLIFTGCATDLSSLNTFSTLYYEHSPHKAYEFAAKKSKNNIDFLWAFQAGVSAYTAGERQANEILDKSEKIFNHFESEGLLSSGLAQTGATLVNDNAMAYRGNIYEGVFINYYKALDRMLYQDFSGARVEFNRANDRQRRAKDYYTKQIMQAMENEQERYNSSDATKNIKQDKSQLETESILKAKYTNLDNFKAFDTFINPAVSYMAGLFFALQQDSKGVEYLKEAYGITHSKTIGDDIVHFTSSPQAQQTQYYTWILLEEGKQAHKTELEFNLPIWTTSGLYHFGIALPQIHNGLSFYQHYALQISQKDIINADFIIFEEITNTDTIISTEFEKQLRAITTRSIVSASIKLAGQVGLAKGFEQVNQSAGLLASLVGSIYTMATTHADLRIASVLPHKILLAKIPSTFSAQEEIIFFADNTPLATIKFHDCAPTLESKAESKIKSKAESKHKQAYMMCQNQNNILYIRQTKNSTILKTLYQKND